MEKRIEALEKMLPDMRERLARVETKLDGIEKHMATKADLVNVKADLEGSIAGLRTAMLEGFASQTKWFIGTAVVLAGIAFTAARFIPGG